MATQDTVTQLIAAIRRVRREVPGAAEVIAAQLHARMTTTTRETGDRLERRRPRGTSLVDALVGDAHRLLGHLPDQDLGPKAAEAVALLALIAGQDVEPVDGSDGTDGRWRIAQRVAPDRVISTVDPDARHAHKTRAPPAGRVQGARRGRTRHRDHHRLRVDQGQRRALRGRRGRARPAGRRARTGRGAGRFRVRLRRVAGRTRRRPVTRSVIKPIPLRPAVPGGFTLDDFTVDHADRTVTCPNGLTQDHQSHRRSRPSERHAAGCPLRERCTTSVTGRSP